MSIYLDDHTNDNDGLTLVPGSHLRRKIATNDARTLHTGLGDVVIFDQRITHRGATSARRNRVLVTFGFGKNNIFTDQFEKGTRVRQEDQKRRVNFGHKKNVANITIQRGSVRVRFRLRIQRLEQNLSFLRVSTSTSDITAGLILRAARAEFARVSI